MSRSAAAVTPSGLHVLEEPFAKVEEAMITICLRASDNESTMGLFERAAAAQFRVVEILFKAQVGSESPSSDDELRSLREAADQAGIQIAALRINCDDGVSLGDPGGESRASASALICGAVDAAVVCGAAIVVVPPELFRRKDGPRLPRDEAYAKLLDAFTQIRFHALHRGITVACDFCRSSAFTSVGEARGFIDWVNSPFVGVSIATSENDGSDAAAEWIALLGHRVKHVMVGPGAHDLSVAFAALRAARFDGVIAVGGADAEALRNELNRMIALSAAS